MNTKKKYIVVIFGLVILMALLYLITIRKKEIPQIIPVDQNYTQEKIELKQGIPVKQKENKEKIPQLSDTKNIKVSLEVLGKKYEVEMIEGSSVFEAMEKIEEESLESNIFSFKYKEYANMGVFINEINGIKGYPGKYWIYYVNDKKASVGASKYILKQADIIKWNQEGI